MTAEQLIARARSAAGNGIKYKLGAGGMDPDSPTPANVDGFCDCSGFSAWCLRMKRFTDHPLYLKFGGDPAAKIGWINCDSMVYDATTNTGFFDMLDQPTPGALLVFPRQDAKSHGHVGIITACKDGQPTRVIHCSSGNYRLYNDAIRETGVEVFKGRKGLLYAWHCGLEI